MHHLPAKKFPQRIRLGRQNDFCHLRARSANRLPRKLRLRHLYASVFSLHSHPSLPAILDAIDSIRIIRDSPMPEQNKTRRQMLEELLAKNPDDAFSRYGLALECMNTGDLAAADTHFRELLERHADYIPAYLMYGQLLVRESRKDEARQVLSSGIASAVETRHEHRSEERRVGKE